MPELDFAERALYTAASLVARLPRSVQQKIAGGPIVRDGQELNPEIAAIMKLGEASGRNLDTKKITPEELRFQQHRGARIAAQGRRARSRGQPADARACDRPLARVRGGLAREGSAL